MTPDQHRRVRDLFEGAFELPPLQRAAWIADAAGDDTAVCDEVRSLLEHDQEAGLFLEQPVLDRVPALLTDKGLIAGSTVGPYTIIRQLGCGGMGLVYLASDSRLGRTVALKAIAPHLARDQSQRERLRQEARAAAGLTHPGICTVYALEDIDDELYISTEFLDGRTLREEMRRATGPPATSALLRTAKQLASALASAHDQGIAHRDLKPENVMRTRDGRLKILDFGLARTDVRRPWSTPEGSSSPANAGELIGTPGYMAPEQLQGDVGDRRADVFALGVLLYEFASGRHPFEAASTHALLSRVIDDEALPLSASGAGLPSGFATLVRRCLEKAPTDRFQSASEIVGALDLIDAETPLSGEANWWRVHQCVLIAIYALGVSLGWLVKEWVAMPATLWSFMAIGVGATIGCVLRGHLLFNERVNRPQFDAERRRTAPARMTVDLLLAVALGIDGVLIVTRPVTSILTIGLAIGIVLAATVVEPATDRAAFT